MNLTSDADVCSLKILFLSAWFPYPPDNGSKIRIYNLIRGLAQVHSVTLISFVDGALQTMPAQLQELCAGIQIVPRRTYNPKSVRSILGLLNPTPRSIVDGYSPPMAVQMRRALEDERFDLVIASELGTAQYERIFRGLPAIFEDVEAGVFASLRERAPLGLPRARHQLTWFKLQRYLRHLLPHFKTCTVVSEQEAALVRNLAPDHFPIQVIPNCVNLADYDRAAGLRDLNSVIFAGSFRYWVNYEAMLWFLKEIFPLIQAQSPGVHLMITGDHANLPLPSAENVSLLGRVDDVRSLVAGSSVCVVPIRLGGGTRLKILEGMALRTPVVSTSKGAEGLSVVDGEHLLVADTSREFADAVIRLLQDVKLRQSLAENAYRLVRANYDWAVVMPRFLDLVEQVGRP